VTQYPSTPGETVYYDDAYGTLVRREGRMAVVQWSTGVVNTVHASDLLTEAQYKAMDAEDAE
jgi:hypothetical protein